MRRSREVKETRDRASAQTLAAQIGSRALEIRARAGEGGRLFGSVTSMDIADAVQAQLGVAVDRRDIALDEPLKELGVSEVAVKLHRDVTATLSIEVVAS